VDVDFKHPDGRRERIRRVSPVQTRRGAEDYERQIRNALLAGTFGREEVAPAPTLAEFADEFLSKYVKTNNKPSEVASKEMTIRVHLKPAMGSKRLDQIGPREVEATRRKDG